MPVWSGLRSGAGWKGETGTPVQGAVVERDGKEVHGITAPQSTFAVHTACAIVDSMEHYTVEEYYSPTAHHSQGETQWGAWGTGMEEPSVEGQFDSDPWTVKVEEEESEASEVVEVEADEKSTDESCSLSQSVWVYWLIVILMVIISAVAGYALVCKYRVSNRGKIYYPTQAYGGELRQWKR